MRRSYAVIISVFIAANCGGSGARSGATPDDRPVLLKRIASRCGVSESDLMFVRYVAGEDLPPNRDGTLQPGFTEFAGRMRPYYVDDNGIIECPEERTTSTVVALDRNGQTPEDWTTKIAVDLDKEVFHCGELVGEYYTYQSVGQVPALVCTGDDGVEIATIVYHGQQSVPQDVAEDITYEIATGLGVSVSVKTVELHDAVQRWLDAHS